MSKIKKIFTNWKVLTLLIFLLLAVVAIYPNFWSQGVTIRNVATNSSASIAGIESPKPTAAPMSKERIISINSKPIENIIDYNALVADLKPNRTLNIRTNEKLYRLKTLPIYNYEILNETEEILVEKIEFYNETVDNVTVLMNKTINETVVRNKVISHIIGTEDIGLSVYDSPTTNIRKGLDLQGGTRVLLQPEEQLTKEDMDTVIENLKQRLNVFGLSDVVIREAGDLSGNQFVLIEIAGANQEEVRELLAKQGKFEAKIANETVFIGGEDITYVCRSADCSGIDPTSGCGQVQDGAWACRFRFSIALSPEAAEKQASLTSKLDVIREEGQREGYLSSPLDLFLDDVSVDSLQISEELKGRAVTEIAISGSGAGATQQEAIFNSLDNMKRLQTILITGSLPVKLNIAKTDSISPVLGEEFLKNAVTIGLAALLAVTVVIFLIYRKIVITIPIITHMVGEVIMLLGFASIVGWNLDLAAIAGIIIAVGTGVDQKIVIVDETLKGDNVHDFDWKRKIKNAFFIIIVAYFTTVAGMIPLWFAGAGLLKGFAFTTIAGVTINVLLSRPSFASVMEVLLKD